MNKDYNEIMTTREVCEYLRVSRNTVKKLMAEGRIKGYMIGVEYRFKKSEIDAGVFGGGGKVDKTGTV